MPTDNTTVGPQSLPIAAGAANGSLDDTTLDGLLSYLGHWLRESLNEKLATQGGPTVSAAITDACPVENLFAWNHRGTFVRRDASGALPLPGLWAWEESQEATSEYATLLYEVVRREIRVQYIFPELHLPKGVNARDGLISSVARVFAKAAERGKHSTFGYDDDDIGTPIWESCSWRFWQYRGGRFEPAAMTPGSTQAAASQRAQGAEKRFFPSFVATFWIWERIGLQEPNEAVADEGTLVIAIAEEGDFLLDDFDDEDFGDAGLDIMERNLFDSDE
jgi:hypothetical protein